MKNREEMTQKIKQLAQQHPYFGYRKIYAILRYKEGLKIHRNKVYQLMKENHLCLPVSRNQKHLFKGVPFSLKVEASQSNALWGIDLTYIWCGEDAWCYLHAVIDHYDKVCLGYHFSPSCKAIGGVMALSEAASKRPVEFLELRSDNGCHYGAQIFKEEVKRLGIKQTRTMINTPKGNAVIERFFKSLKQECVWQEQFKNFEEAKEKIDQWIDFYNHQRPHQTLNYATPETFYNNQSLRKLA